MSYALTLLLVPNTSFHKSFEDRPASHVYSSLTIISRLCTKIKWFINYISHRMKHRSCWLNFLLPQTYRYFCWEHLYFFGFFFPTNKLIFNFPGRYHSSKKFTVISKWGMFRLVPLSSTIIQYFLENITMIQVFNFAKLKGSSMLRKERVIVFICIIWQLSWVLNLEAATYESKLLNRHSANIEALI